MTRLDWRLRLPLAGPAIALLSLAALALAVLSCKGGYDRGSFDTPTDPSRQFLILSIAGGAASLPADGVSTVQLTAAISPDAIQRVIEFTTTAGTLVGGTGTATDQTVTADSSGRATLALQSPQSPGPAVITAKVQAAPAVAQSVQFTFVPAGADDLIRVVSAPSSAPADGASASAVTVAISGQIPAASRTVTFSTNNGSFVQGGNSPSVPVVAGADLRATALLYSPAAIGEAIVTVTVANASRQLLIRFERANPDLVTLQLSDITVQNAASAKLTATATLLRNVGAVTPGTEVTFEAIRLDTLASFGLFTSNPTVSGSTGTASATFSPGGGTFTGLARMSARAGSRSASLDFQVTAPP